MKVYFWIVVTGILIVTGSCSSSKKISQSSSGISGLKFIGGYNVSNDFTFQGTHVGGLSGIDYDKSGDLYYIICDDPSARNPARFYTARLRLSEKGIDTVQFVGVDTILDPQGNAYADITKNILRSADLEAMRYDPLNDFLVRTSEGQRRMRDGKHDLQNPDIVIMDRSGRWKDSIALPANMNIQAIEKGPRHNSVFEGLDFADNYQALFISLEEALYEDGPRAGTADSTSWVRFIKFDMKTKKQVAQYAYEIDPVPHAANPPNAFKINGISDIMYLGNEKFIVIERAFSSGRIFTDIRVYLADARGAEDISGIESLEQRPVKKPIHKKLLMDMNKEVSQGVFNVEGVTFGPLLSNGHRSLVFVTDNNFNPKEKTQFFLFEVLP